jgi:hypothetical protein
VSDRPEFVLDVLTNQEREQGEPFVSTDGRRWLRVVFGGDGPCAAEDEYGTLTVWDEAALFEAVFRVQR